MNYQSLLKQFDYVSDLFKDDVKWTLHESVPKDDVPAELIYFDRYIKSEEAIKEMEGKGYRPATHEELIEWAEKNTDKWKENYVAALGSSTMLGDDRYVAMLNGGSGRRILGDRWFDRGWYSDYRFLFVRKGSSDTRTLRTSEKELAPSIAELLSSIQADVQRALEILKKK